MSVPKSKSPFQDAIDHLKQTGKVAHATEDECINQLIFTRFLNSSVYKDHEATQHFICQYDNEKYSLFPMKCADSKKDKTPIKTAELAFFPNLLVDPKHRFSPGNMKKWVHKVFDDLDKKKIINLVEITRIKGAGNPYLPFFTDKIIHDCGNLFDGKGKAPKLITNHHGEPKYIVTWGAKIDTSSTSGKESINSKWNRVNVTDFNAEIMKILGHFDCSLKVPTSKIYNDNKNQPDWKRICDQHIEFNVDGKREPNMLEKAVGAQAKGNDKVSAFIKSLGDGYRATEIVSEGFIQPPTSAAPFNLSFQQQGGAASGSARGEVLTALTCDSVLGWQWNFFIEIFGLDYAQFVYTHNEKGGKKISKLYFRPSIVGVDYFQDIKTEFTILQEQYANVLDMLTLLAGQQLFMDDNYYDASEKLLGFARDELHMLKEKIQLKALEAEKTNEAEHEENKQEKLKEILFQLKKYTLYPVLFKRKDQVIKTTRNRWLWCEAQPNEVKFFGEPQNKKNNRMGVIFTDRTRGGMEGGNRSRHTRESLRLKREIAQRIRREKADKDRRTQARYGKVDRRTQRERIRNESCYMTLDALSSIYKNLYSIDSYEITEIDDEITEIDDKIWESISSKRTWEIILDYVYDKYMSVFFDTYATIEKKKLTQAWGYPDDVHDTINTELISKLLNEYKYNERKFAAEMEEDVMEEGVMEEGVHSENNDSEVKMDGGAAENVAGPIVSSNLDTESNIDESIMCLKIEIYSMFHNLVKILAEDNEELFEKILEYFKKNEMIDTITLPPPRRFGPQQQYRNTARLNCLYDEEPSLVNLLYYKYHVRPDYSFRNNWKLMYELFVDIFISDSSTLDIETLRMAVRAELMQQPKTGGGCSNKKKKYTKKNNKRNYTKKRRNRNKPKGNTIKNRNITKSQKKRRPKFSVSKS